MTRPKHYSGTANEVPQDVKPKFEKGFHKSAREQLQVPLSSTAIALEDNIYKGRIDPIERLKAGLASTDLELETVWVCLNSYKSTLYENRQMTRAERIRTIQKDRVGALSLQWLWQDEKRWAYAIGTQTIFLETLSWYVVAEGYEQYLMDVLGSPADQAIYPAWRGALLRTIVRAMARIELQHSADKVIDLFLRTRSEILELRKRAMSSRSEITGYARTSTWPAAVEISTALIAHDMHRTSPRKYDDFVRAWQQHRQTREERAADSEYAFARLALGHPKAPDPVPMLGILRKWTGAAKQVKEEEALPAIADFRIAAVAACNKLETVLSQLQRHEDLRWVREARSIVFTEEDLRNFEQRKRNRGDKNYKREKYRLSKTKQG